MGVQNKRAKLEGWAKSQEAPGLLTPPTAAAGKKLAEGYNASLTAAEGAVTEKLLDVLTTLEATHIEQGELELIIAIRKFRDEITGTP